MPRTLGARICLRQERQQGVMVDGLDEMVIKTRLLATDAGLRPVRSLKWR